MRYHTISALSDRIHETPEGYLLCLDVPLARLGVQEYLAEEMPDAAPNKAGTVLVRRLEADVFAESAIASFEAKPVTLLHPESPDGDGIDFVSPENWQELSRGVVIRPRRGEGDEADLLLADLLITEPEAIAAVKDGMREVSCGYDAEIEELSPGLARQKNIVGNHVALVPHGRCGARCSIRDWEIPMAKKPSLFDRLFRNPQFKKLVDEAAAEEAKEEKAGDNDPASGNGDTGEQPATDNDLSALAAKLDEMLLLLRSLAEGKTSSGDEDPEATGDEDPEGTADDDPDATGDDDPETEKTGDARKRRAADADTVHRAKLLAPHLSFRVGDSACVTKRAALRSAVKDSRVRNVVDACLRGNSLDGADCLTLDAAFAAASEVAKAANNRRTADSLGRASVKDFGKSVTPADINKMNREFHAAAKGK